MREQDAEGHSFIIIRIFQEVMLFIFSSAGQGGGSGGSIRDAGGSFGKMEQAQEEQFFRKLQQDQLKKMKTDTENETTKDTTDKDKEKKKASK